MYAIFQNGSKQYRAKEGQIIRLEKLGIEIGKIIEFTEILMIVTSREVKIGAPFVYNSFVKAKIIAHGRGEKIKIMKFFRRKHYRKKQGHRQCFTDVKITDIKFSN